ncbi:MAG TPA: hypothetical protein VGJ54_04595 [Streptosporangiaceae bacterium]
MDRWASWQAEQTGTSPLPSAGQALGLFAAVALVLLTLLAGPQATAERGQGGGHRVDSPACAERDRLTRHGVTTGASYRRAAAACTAGASR